MRCDCTASHRMVHGAIHRQTACVWLGGTAPSTLANGGARRRQKRKKWGKKIKLAHARARAGKKESLQPSGEGVTGGGAAGAERGR